MAQGKVKKKSSKGSADSQWSEGLISAARLVATATQSLCEAANALVQGEGEEEQLIAAAKQVSRSTSQLRQTLQQSTQLSAVLLASWAD